MGDRDTARPEAGDAPELAQTLPSATVSTPGVALELTATARPLAGATRYRVGDEIARGGVGVVRAAIDERLDRAVAIKELLVPAPRARVRFEREARITARLEHPGVVPIYDHGWDEAGAPFYVMRRVAGRTLTELIDARAALTERLGLVTTVLAVADTVAYAHDRRIIHRDLKPGNVLVGDHGQVIVIDWGLAKELSAAGDDEPDATADPDEPDLTAIGAVMGTPAYMAPEQARGAACDPRSDVYALGVMLYAVLAGEPPHRGATHDVVRAVADGRVEPLRVRAPGAPAELIAIVEHAMAHEPERRYPTARELAADLRAFQDGQLVSTYRYGRRARARRWLRRHRVTVAVAAALTLALAIMAVVSVRRITGERDRAQQALAAVRDRDRELALRHAEAQLDVDPTAAAAWIKRAVAGDDTPSWLARSLASSAAARGLAWQVVAAEVFGSPLLSDGTRAITAADGSTVWTIDGERLTAIARGLRRPRPLAATRDRAVIGTRTDTGGGIVVVDPATGNVLLRDEAGVPRAGAIADDGAVWWVDAGGALRRVTATGASELARVGPEASSLAVAGDGAFVVGRVDGVVALGGGGHSLRFVDANRREVSFAQFVAGVPYTAADDGVVLAWDTPDGAPRELGRHDDWIACLAVSPDRRWLATGSGDRTIRLWSLDGGAHRVLRGHDATVLALAWAADGRLASGAADGSLRLWRIDGGTVRIPAGGTVRRLAWIDGALAGTVGGTLRVWRDLPAVPQVLPGALGDVDELVWSSDGTYLAAGGRGQRVAVWRTATGERVLERALGARVTALAFGAGDRLIIATDELAEAWDLAPVAPRGATATAGGLIVPVAVPGSDRVAWIDDVRFAVTVRDLAGGVATIARGVRLTHLAITPDGSAAITGDLAGEVTRWPLDGGAPRRYGNIGRVEEVAIAPDGAWVAGVARDGAAWVWPAAGGLGRELPQAAGASGLQVAAGGRVIATVDRWLVLADATTGEERRLAGHRAPIVHAARSRDGASLATSDTGGEVRVWRLADGASAVVGGAWRPATPLTFAPDGRLAAVGNDGAVRVVAVPVARDVDLAGWLEAATTAAIDAELAVRSPAP